MYFRCFGSLFVALGAAFPAYSATFTPAFDTPSFVGTQFNVESDPSYNDFYRDNFGIEVSNSYLYVDIRDAFDGIGIANGLREANNVPGQSGRIDFLDSTDFVDIDYVSIRSGGTYSAFDAVGDVIDEFTTGGGTSNGTYRFDGNIISYITFNGIGGQVGISALTYNYDGTTDGINEDIETDTPVVVIPPVVNGPKDDGPTVNVVPLPAGGFMFLAAFGLLATMRRKS